MDGFERGVKYYTSAFVELIFPEDRVCCEFCALLETYSRKQCRRTGEYLADLRAVGYLCPLMSKEGMNNHTKENE